MWLPFALASVFVWAMVNVLDSVIVAHYEQRPMILSWNQSLFSVSALLLFALAFRPQTHWFFPLLLAGICGYGGDLLFWRALARIDVSVINLAWAFQAVILSITGFLLFAEHWTLLQTAGTCCVLGSILFLSGGRRHLLAWPALILLCCIALLYAPFYAVQKAALLHGIHFTSVFFWPLVGREGAAFFVPLLLPRTRAIIRQTWRGRPPLFHGLNAAVIALFFGGLYCSTRAFAAGPLSLVSIAANIQPFVVLALAGIWVLLLPRFAPRELLGSQAVWVKVAGFTGVFLGLALLSVSQ
jgi:drug/metabolite transporter (DMT)-like permease